ncbi:uncharacterized protein BYT42DRAFT_610058 [Radiomyces spectabilis]|uniref:uncharacterized protein n=1 Tax=Radiomyces spectabilis TaxID=64574 RepID=UPI0022207C9C|nr:uncharacterized protein BYT42DRAFT_610058 [Radiomyces spectabilis]KAI8394341.1 hypothetical protein BYT42DRAFT_610058 [Radiomyces spectabilis]
MKPEASTDLPPEILEKLRNLELELEEGDITPKGFEKKKATLLEQCKAPSTAEEEEEIDYGPEPSAADVVDFLDYLPSPTHSPPRPASGASYMERNHQQGGMATASPDPSIYNHPSSAAPRPQFTYRPYPLQQPQTHPQHLPLQHQRQQQYDGAYGWHGAPPVSDNYYPATMASQRPNRPYMAPRGVLQGQPIQSSSGARYPYPPNYPARPTIPIQTPTTAPYRAPYPTRPVYGGNPALQHTEMHRPVYRPVSQHQHIPMRPPPNYHPAGAQVTPGHSAPGQHIRTSSLDARADVHYVNRGPSFRYANERMSNENMIHRQQHE